ncbi:DUF1028 domain-containing protein [Marivita geojedonensis]|uniref:Major pilin protein fimA n=1 Tax=Marivita geojedonensis TaxID=1123756 RepID=A0A1X4NMU5_9RHOB|nr:DUF1028 domain-containing protein [Marivita geojedonensis]OSQ51724.1 major pilin protein fimA [Marivita geojedonensis]PRY79276.1 putative Ntn-hydrolase superfamily protein [Marivita geojedonensis]
MTLSILTFDRKTGVFAAAAATGSLCVGGWVLRGDIESGLVASQGTAPSTFWRDDILRAMYGGTSASDAVAKVTDADDGRAFRQVAALDRNGTTAAFTGQNSIPHADHMAEPGQVISGNMLAGPEVLDAMADAARDTRDRPAERMLRILNAAKFAGGDSRGLQSAALLVLTPDAPPLDLRIDCSEDPLGALATLLQKAQQPPYHDWLSEVPVISDKTRRPA